ncbi:MAG: cation:proton antiporter [Planctomycetota bacterium]|nr:MAG: cation:proton antiporter [Planctomycetota bacterium]REJ87518.1 MAG: cation:proton antiporter [Planctomycetota bacterium]REK31104.1 MAG: cation:proton antiporter [Planctomycetota bacterium]REK44350.1 MAG: cation:proton antiporter [Planctomycetota bacterium]
MNLPSLMFSLILPALVLAVALAFVRLARGPSLPDRVIALDVLASFAIAILAAYSVATGQVAFLDVGLVLGLVSFLGTIAFARYIERSTR